MSKEELMTVPVKLVRELKEVAADRERGYAERQHGDTVNHRAAEKLVILAAKFPDPPVPPKPDHVAECLSAWDDALEATSRGEDAMMAALRVYRNLGCPELE